MESRHSHTKAQGAKNVNKDKDIKNGTSSAASASTEEEDPIVAEIPVVLTKDLIDQLYLLQFPGTPSHVPIMEHLNIVDARIKSKQGKFQLISEIDPSSKFYDQQKGAKLCPSDDQEEDEDDEDIDVENEVPSQKLKKHVMESTNVKANGQNLAVAYFDENILYLTPVKGVVQMNTVLPYLEESQKRKGGAAGGKDDNSDEEKEDEGTKVQVKFQRSKQQANVIKDRGPKKHSAFTKRDEPWVDLAFEGYDANVFEKLTTNYNRGKDDEDEDVGCKLTSADLTALNTLRNVSHREYANSLVPNPTHLPEEVKARAEAVSKLSVRTPFKVNPAKPGPSKK